MCLHAKVASAFENRSTSTSSWRYLFVFAFRFQLTSQVVVISQIFVAGQMVLEERLFSKYQLSPLDVVGWEGLWGFLLSCPLLIPAYLAPFPFKDNAIEAMQQMTVVPLVAILIVGYMLSIAVYNACGERFRFFFAFSHAEA